MHFLKCAVLGHVQVFKVGETYSSVAQTNCLTQIIDGDLLILPDNIANKLKCSPCPRFHVPYALSHIKVDGSSSACGLPCVKNQLT